MSEAVPAQSLITPEAYLVAERAAEQRHELVGGRVYALAGASREHNLIAGNLFALLWHHLGEGPCRVFGSDMRLRAAADVFYYPDVMVCCDETDDNGDYAARPRYLVEVASPTTRRVDEAEKVLAYQRLPSLEAYVMADQDAMRVRLLRRRGAGWEIETLTQPDDRLRLEGIGFSVPLSAVYARTRVSPGAPGPGR